MYFASIREIGKSWKSISQAMRDSYLCLEELLGNEHNYRNDDGLGHTLST